MDWHCDSEVEGTEDKMWRNEELRSLEVELPHIECREPRERRGYKATTSVGCHGFHPRVPLDLSKENEGKSDEVSREG